MSKDELAFPKIVEIDLYRDLGHFGDVKSIGGLTKREYFAAAALQGFLANGWNAPKEIAERAVEFADALILALEAKNER